MNNAGIYTMKEACEAMGLTYDALKFYCDEGLVPNAKKYDIITDIIDLGFWSIAQNIFTKASL